MKVMAMFRILNFLNITMTLSMYSGKVYHIVPVEHDRRHVDQMFSNENIW